MQIRLHLPIVRCSPDLESRNLKGLVLIPFRLIGATRAGGLRRAAPVTRAAGRPAFPPRRRLPDLSARPLSAHALSKLLDRKPHLLRPLAKQLLPPPLAVGGPAERLGIDLSSLGTAEDCRQVLAAVPAAIAR